jgi:predicted amidohydrolase YtcJ
MTAGVATERLVVADTVRTPAGLQGDAIRLRGERVVEIGMAPELRGLGLPEERYPGGVIVPGLRDAHFHPVTYAATVSGASLKEAAGFAEVIERVGERAAALGPGVPVSAMRLDDESLAEGRLPTRHDLDAAFPDRPVLLHRYCGHIGVANTAALDLADVGPDTVDPPEGSFDREDGGMPTGILRETAVGVVARAMSAAAPPVLTPERLVAAMAGLAGLGLTSLGAIVGCGDDTWADLGDQAAALREVAADLPIRLNVLVIADTAEELERNAALFDRAGPNLRFLGLKAFSDGSLGGHTAAMNAPFADRTDTRGMVRLDPVWARGMADAALGMGGMVAIHAIGDHANGMVLDVFEQLIADGADPARLRVEHASVLDESLVQRFAAGGVTASVQPAFLASETEWLEKRVGAERMRWTYPLRTLRDAGVPLAGGSDCPVEPPHPLWGIAAARDRAGLVPEESLTATEALALFTDWAAAALDEPAPLAPGSPADFTVLDRDPATATPDELRGARIVDTWVGGHPVDVPADAVVWQG